MSRLTILTKDTIIAHIMMIIGIAVIIDVVCIVLRGPLIINRTAGINPMAKAQNNRFHLAGSSPISSLLDVTVANM